LLRELRETEKQQKRTEKLAKAKSKPEVHAVLKSWTLSLLDTQAGPDHPVSLLQFSMDEAAVAQKLNGVLEFRFEQLTALSGDVTFPLQVVIRPLDVHVVYDRNDGAGGRWSTSFDVGSLRMGVRQSDLASYMRISRDLLQTKDVLRELFNPPQPRILDRLRRGELHGDVKQAKQLSEIWSLLRDGRQHLDHLIESEVARLHEHHDLHRKYGRSTDLGVVTTRGYLSMRKGEHRGATWRRLWIELCDGHLYYYASEESRANDSNAHLGKIAIETDMILEMAATVPNCLVLKLSNQKVFISMESEEDVMLWMNSLLKVQTMLHELMAIREDADEKRSRSEAATREQLEYAVSCLTGVEQVVAKLGKKVEKSRSKNAMLRKELSEARTSLAMEIEDKQALITQIKQLQATVDRLQRNATM